MFEGSTLLLLVLLAVPLKHFGGMPQLVRVLGPLHGVAFLAYLHQLVSLRSQVSLGAGQTAKLFLAAFIPGGTFWALRSEL